MGITTLKVEVGNVGTPRKTETLEFIVDSGAAYSVVPAQVLRRLKVKPIVKEEFRLADGSRITRRKGVAFFKYLDKKGGSDVIFGEEGDATLLGSLTLESLGLALDPIRRELKSFPSILFLLHTQWTKRRRRLFPKGSRLRQGVAAGRTVAWMAWFCGGLYL